MSCFPVLAVIDFLGAGVGEPYHVYNTRTTAYVALLLREHRFSKPRMNDTSTSNSLRFEDTAVYHKLLTQRMRTPMTTHAVLTTTAVLLCCSMAVYVVRNHNGRNRGCTASFGRRFATLAA